MKLDYDENIMSKIFLLIVKIMQTRIRCLIVMTSYNTVNTDLKYNNYC